MILFCLSTVLSKLPAKQILSFLPCYCIDSSPERSPNLTFRLIVCHRTPLSLCDNLGSYKLLWTSVASQRSTLVHVVPLVSHSIHITTYHKAKATSSCSWTCVLAIHVAPSSLFIQAIYVCCALFYHLYTLNFKSAQVHV